MVRIGTVWHNENHHGQWVHCAVVMCGARLVSEAWTYLHKGSFSQSRGNPIARMSMLGY